MDLLPSNEYDDLVVNAVLKPIWRIVYKKFGAVAITVIAVILINNALLLSCMIIFLTSV